MLIRKQLLKYYEVKKYLDLINKNSYAGLYKLDNSTLLTEDLDLLKLRDHGISAKITIALSNDTIPNRTIITVKEELQYILKSLHADIVSIVKNNIDKINILSEKVLSLKLLLESVDNLRNKNVAIKKGNYSDSIKKSLSELIESKKLDITPVELLNKYGNSIRNSMLIFEVLRRDIDTVLNANISYLGSLMLNDDNKVKKVMQSHIIDIYKSELKNEYISNRVATTYSDSDFIDAVYETILSNNSNVPILDNEKLIETKNVITSLIKLLDETNGVNEIVMLMLSSLFNKLDILNVEIDAIISDSEDVITIISDVVNTTTD